MYMYIIIYLHNHIRLCRVNREVAQTCCPAAGPATAPETVQRALGEAASSKQKQPQHRRVFGTLVTRDSLNSFFRLSFREPLGS